MTVLERIKKIGEKWFLTEPLLFATYCSHNLVENDSLVVPMRTGNRRVEFAPKCLDKVKDDVLSEFLKVEMFRILLKHPYQRQPPFASKALLTMASNATIADVYDLSENIKQMMNGAEMMLPHGLCFEEYYRLLKEMASQASGGNDISKADESRPSDGASSQKDDEKENSQKTESDESCDSTEEKGANGEGVGRSFRESQTEQDEPVDGNVQISELWEENEESCCDINSIIETAMESDTWGSVPGSLQAVIKASLKVEMDYRKMLSLFKTSVISSKRHLTRMRPNRRFGFDAMGSRYELTTNLLIAIDVSGSVSDKSLSYFFSVINRLFKYGVQKLDVVQFDSEIKGEPEQFRKARKTIKIMGRGGTNFQPVADYYCNYPEYDGLIYFTDGYANPPRFNTKRVIDVLWVLCGKTSYESNRVWIKKLKRNRVTYIPRSE